jgi:PAS domain S-box-containing protein
MEPYLQKKALTIFHYALNPKGFLVLGKSETTGGVPDLFTVDNKNEKIFIRKDVPAKFIQVTSQRGEQILNSFTGISKKENIRTDFQKTADEILLSKYTPAGVVINEAMDIVHFRGSTGNYLEQAPGKPSHNLMMMAKFGLAFELRNILHKSKKEKIPVVKENIPLDVNGNLRNISIEAIPLPNTAEPYYLVLFHDQNSINIDETAGVKRKKETGKFKKDDNQIRIQLLERELSQLREDMRSITEEQEASNEELQSANEELLSGSEELQSLNEEMETSKEELQSTNEELTVLNNELVNLNEQVTDAKNYAESIVATMSIPLLVLDKNLRVKTANQAFYDTFKVNAPETEDLLVYDLGNRQWNIPELRILLEEILPQKSKITNYEVTHNFSSIGERTILLNALEIKRDKKEERLILLSIADITEQRKASDIISKSGERFRNLVKELPAAVYACDAQGRITFHNKAAEVLWGRKPVIGKDLWCGSIKIFKPDGSALAIEKCPMSITLKEGRSIVGEEIIIERPDGSRSNVLANPHPEFGVSGELTGAINMLIDITKEVSAKRIIEESEIKFRQMAELMPQKIWTSDSKGLKNYFNKTLLDYAGMSIEDLIGNGWEKIIHPDDWKKNKRKWDESIKSGKNYVQENRLLRKDGKYLWHLTMAIALKDDKGKITSWVGTKTEIQGQKEQKEELENAVFNRTRELQEANYELGQKQKELVETKEKLLNEYSRSLIEASVDPLVTINPDGKITDMNQATIKITGSSREKLTGTNFFDYFTEPQKASEVYTNVFDNGSVINAPLTLMDAEGKFTDVLLNGSVYKDGKGQVTGVVMVARDVTEQKRISTELTEAIVYAEMSTLIAEQEKLKSEEARKIAEDAVKAKQQFLSNMSHEIRTPMNAIIGFTKVILKTDLTPKQKEYLSAIKISGDALIVLINDILDLAKVDAGKMTFEEIPFKLKASISAMIHLFEPRIEEKNLQLVKEYDEKIPEVLIGDPMRLHQIILNLLSNAVKFTTKGNISISLHLLEEDEEKVNIEFTISDTGEGIPENKRESIFENFHQASSDTSRLYGGTGLGLAIVKQLVESQGGVIQVKSKENEGSVFSFSLNFKKTNAEPESQNTSDFKHENSENKSIKVLVAEDIALNQLLMKTLLDEFGFEIEIAGNGKIAIEKLREKKFDIVLMDLQMPVMNGFEATEYIRKEMNDNIPIIALTADVTTVDLAKCRSVGMNDYISKPVDDRVLYSIIMSYVKKPENKSEIKKPKPGKKEVAKCTDLTYLHQRTKSNPELITEIISLYLAQTPDLIAAMNQSLENKHWNTLQSAAHKIIPSFIIVGINNEFEMMAKKIQEYANTQQHLTEIPGLLLQIEQICVQACNELENEITSLKNINK